MISVETADNALKSFYLDAVTEALDFKANPLLAKIERSSIDVIGKDVKKLVKYGIHGGISAGSETGDLPAASSNDKIVLTSTLKNLYGTIEISDKALRAAAGSEGAFVNFLNDEMQSLIRSAKFNFGRMLYGDGSGRIANLNNIEEDNMLLVDNIAAFTEGMFIDFVNDGMVVEAASKRKVLVVDKANSRIIISGAPLEGVVKLDADICLHGSKGYEITGLGAIFSDSEQLYGVDRSKSSLLRPYIFEEMGNFNESTLECIMDEIEDRAGGKINLIVCSKGVRRAITEYYRENKSVLAGLECKDGFNTITFNGIPVVADPFCPACTMYLLNTDDFKIHQLCDWKWLEGEDGKILKQVPGKPVYTATLVKYAELMCERPFAQGMITGINEP